MDALPPPAPFPQACRWAVWQQWPTPAWAYGWSPISARPGRQRASPRSGAGEAAWAYSLGCAPRMDVAAGMASLTWQSSRLQLRLTVHEACFSQTRLSIEELWLTCSPQEALPSAPVRSPSQDVHPCPNLALPSPCPETLAGTGTWPQATPCASQYTSQSAKAHGCGASSSRQEEGPAAPALPPLAAGQRWRSALPAWPAGLCMRQSCGVSREQPPGEPG